MHRITQGKSDTIFSQMLLRNMHHRLIEKSTDGGFDLSRHNRQHPQRTEVTREYYSELKMQESGSKRIPGPL